MNTERVQSISRRRDQQNDAPNWSAQGVSDGFGDRLLMLDDKGVPTWEVLRLRWDFASPPDVQALQARLAQLAGLKHPSFPSVRVVEEPGEGAGCLLMSAYAAGRRLSELKRARSAAFAMTLIQDLIGPLAALQMQGEAVSHGSLTADRILITPDGKLLIRDHLLGAVLDRLSLPAAQLSSDLGVLARTDRLVPGRQMDVIHVALVALSTLLGRSIGSSDYPAKIEEIVDQHVLFPPLRRWLEAAFELTGPGLTSAEEAQEAIHRYFPKRLPGESDTRESLALFGGRGAEPRPPSVAGPVGLKRFFQEFRTRHPFARRARPEERLIERSSTAMELETEGISPGNAVVSPVERVTVAARRDVVEPVLIVEPSRIQGVAGTSRDVFSRKFVNESDLDGVPEAPAPPVLATVAVHSVVEANPAPPIAEIRPMPPVVETIGAQAVKDAGAPAVEGNLAQFVVEESVRGEFPADAVVQARPGLGGTERSEREPSERAQHGKEGDPRRARPKPRMVSAEEPQEPSPLFRADEEDQPVNRSHWLRWAVAGLVVVAVAQATIIGRMYLAGPVLPPVPQPTESIQPPQVTAVATISPTDGAPTSKVDSVQPTSAVEQRPRPAGAPAPPPIAPDRVVATTAPSSLAGGLRLSSSIDLNAFEGDRLVGSTGAGPIALPPGRHVLEIVNSALGYRSSRVVEITSGLVQTLKIEPEKGSLNINASPWAEVWVDGKPVGETPIGLVPATLGEHEIIFRHPQLGERRQKILVRSDGVTRVAVDLTR